jgi:hypothetical protein
MIILGRKKQKKISSSVSLNLSINFEKKFAFQVFSDLCLSRKWSSVRIFSVKPNSEYGVFAQNPENGEIEIFIPIFSETKIKLDKLKVFSKFDYPIGEKKTFRVLNLAMVDSDSTIAYYHLSLTLHKSSGPLV